MDWLVSYFDGASGVERVFATEQEAIAFAEEKWGHLTPQEKTEYAGADGYGGYFVIQKGHLNADDWEDVYDVAWQHRHEVPGWYL